MKDACTNRQALAGHRFEVLVCALLALLFVPNLTCMWNDRAVWFVRKVHFRVLLPDSLHQSGVEMKTHR